MNKDKKEFSENLDKLKKLLAERLGIEEKRRKLRELEFEVSDSDLWQNNKILAEAKVKEFGISKNLIEKFDAIDSVEKLHRFEVEAMTGSKYEFLPSIISVYPGAGGKDAEDWAVILLKMYEKYATYRGWGFSYIDDFILKIKGEDSYNILRKESGVHRLVRISPYDSKKLRHTSFALVEVLPDLKKADVDKIQIPEKDIKFEFSRSSGPGGQNVNKVETAVKVVYLPTGLTASSQSCRSQAQNREQAINILKAKIIKLMEVNRETEIEKLKTKTVPEWGSQIRSYVMHPYKLVKDHRTGVETTKIDEVLDGRLDDFIASR